MSFEAAINYLDDYREKRSPALNNEERQKWFTTPLSNVGQLSTDIFDSQAENAEWEGLYTARTSNLLLLESVRLKIAFLAGCRRDVRMIFSAWSSHRVRVPLDHDRFEYMRLNFHRLRTQSLKQVVETKKNAGS